MLEPDGADEWNRYHDELEIIWGQLQHLKKYVNSVKRELENKRDEWILDGYESTEPFEVLSEAIDNLKEGLEPGST